MGYTFCYIIVRSLTCVIFNPFFWFNMLQVIDLTRVSQELAYLANDADLVILEGMVSSSMNIIGYFEPQWWRVHALLGCDSHNNGEYSH